MALVYHLFLFSLLLPLSYFADPIAHYCAKAYISNKIQPDINQLLSDLVAKAMVGGFAVSQYSKGSNTIYGLAQCRGDVSSDDCSACLAGAAKQLPVTCANEEDGRLWYDYCFMRYDTDNFIGQTDTGCSTIIYNTQNATNPDAFDKKVNKLMSKVNAEASTLRQYQREAAVWGAIKQSLRQTSRSMLSLSVRKIYSRYSAHNVSQ